MRLPMNFNMKNIYIVTPFSRWRTEAQWKWKFWILFNTHARIKEYTRVRVDVFCKDTAVFTTDAPLPIGLTIYVCQLVNWLAVTRIVHFVFLF